MIFGILCAILLSRGSSLQVLPAVTLRSDDTEISRSCRVVIPKGTTITDRHGDGVIQITASGIVVQFVEGAELCGAAEGTTPDAFKGIGIRIAGHKNVTILGGRIRGYWCAIEASDADGLVLEGVDASDNRRARLRSTPAAEDAGDWLWPHANDGNEWLARYGAAISIEGSSGVTVRRCRARACQNGLILDRVDGSQIYDNDFSFLSGWGIALWRSSGNVLSRNAVDFCVRGYSHGVYNRGQTRRGCSCSSSAAATSSRRTRRPTAGMASSASPGGRRSGRRAATSPSGTGGAATMTTCSPAMTSPTRRPTASR
ncbi:MAG: right-handed parallel beta-helix repeat-containing protein [Planctomycetota bacterium]